MKALALVAVIFLSALGSSLAAPQISQPECAPLEVWAGQVNAETYDVAPRLQLPKALDDAHVVPLFGAGVLSWTQEDLQAANQLLTKCWTEAGKRRDAAAAGALANANRALQGLVPRVNGALQKARTDADAVGRQIAGRPDSPELDRGLEALLKANPAQPDVGPFRGLPREIADPLWRLDAQVLPFLTAADRAALLKNLGERHAAIQAAVTDTAEKSIASASADAGGMIDLMAVRQHTAAIEDAAARARIDQAAAERLKQIAEALRQAKPPVWVTPGCADLYRWSGADGAKSF